eukprot:TRINITY_DN4260_c0_g1_i1.p1 TRINITY_DN4260_c0_g1~~TRINITY_DN4260_c0_g1_i1.p1  ORF type:complete len:2529 (+),score=417.65 TRINITY_DN4260_c0_g1_i1:27-7613(+)
MGDDNLKTGDLVVLFAEEGEEDGYLSLSDSGESLYVKTVKDKDCVFKLYPITQTTHGEVYSNQDTITQLEGKDIIFGQIIQLQHCKSTKFVACEVFDTNVGGAERYSLCSETTGSKRCWFKVMPHSRGVEGDKVKQGDKIRLQNVLTGCHVHQSDILTLEGNHEVDLRSFFSSGDKVTPWVISHSDDGANRRATLRNKSVIRLFHDQTGYLFGNPKIGVSTKFYFGANDRVASYKTIWEIISDDIEKSDIPDADIAWEQPFQLRLYGTDYYLTLSKNESNSQQLRSPTSSESNIPEIIDEFGDKLSLTKNKSDPNTFYTFVPVKKESDDIPIGSHLWISCYTKKYWVHCPEDISYQYNPSTKGSAESPLSATLKFSFKDAFVLKPVPKYQIDDFNYVATRIPKLREYLDRIREPKLTISLDKKVKAPVVELLSDLIKFSVVPEHIVQDTSVKKEGTPDPIHQKLLASSELLEILSEMAIVGPNQDLKISTLTYKLLKHIVRNNPQNGTMLHSILRLPTFSSSDDKYTTEELVKYFRQVPVADTLLSIYKGNQDLIYNLNKKFVVRIIQILSTTLDPQYLEFLSGLCHFEKTVIYDNQEIIATALHQNADQVVIKMKLQGNNVLVRPHNNEKWFHILEFTAPRKFPEDEVAFLGQLLRLYSNLCVGRNSKSIKILTSTDIGLSFPLAFNCLREKNLLPKYRAAFCDLLLYVFTDVYGQNPQITKLKKNWFKTNNGIVDGNVLLPSRLANAANDEEDDDKNIESVIYNLPAPSTDQKTSFPSPQNLLEFMIDYLFDPYQIRFDATQQTTNQPEFLSRVILLVRHAFFFGIFKRMEFTLVQRLIDILSVHPNFDHNNLPRQLDAHHHEILIFIKREAMLMIERFFEMQTSQLFENYMNYFSQNQSQTDETQIKREMLNQLQNQIDIEKSSAASLNILNLQSNTPNTIESDFPALQRLTPVLLGQLYHCNSSLTKQALRLAAKTVRMQNRWRNLIFTVSKVQILSSSKHQTSYQNIQKYFDQVCFIASQEITKTSLDQFVDLMDQMCELCEVEDTKASIYKITRNKPHVINQNIIRNMEIHEEIIDIARRPIESKLSDEEKGQIVSSCYRFLSAFVRGNKENQLKLYPFHHVMIHQMLSFKNLKKYGLVSQDVAMTIIEIFRDNLELCEMITEKQLNPFITMIFEHNHDATYLEFFRVVVSPANNILKSNQNLVLKALVSMPNIKKILKLSESGLLTSRKSPKSPKKLKQSVESSPKTGVLSPRSEDDLNSEAMDRYRIGLITLLALCCAGKNFWAENICQGLLSLEDCIDVCASNQNRSYQITSAYAFFAEEVYLNTESTSLILPSVYVLQYNKKVWHVITNFKNVLLDVIKLRSNDDEDFERFVYQVILPFLEHFYTRSFSLKNAQKSEIDLSNVIMDHLFNLRQMYKKNKEKNAVILASMRALFGCGITGLEQLQSISKLMKSVVSKATLSTTDNSNVFIQSKEDEFLSNLQNLKYFISQQIWRSIVEEFFVSDIITLPKKEKNKKKDKDKDKDKDVVEDIDYNDDDGIPLEDFKSFTSRGDDVTTIKERSDESSFYINTIFQECSNTSDDSLVLMSLQILLEYIIYDNKKTPVSENKRNKKLEEAEIPLRVAALLSSKDKTIVHYSLTVLTLVLTKFTDGKGLGTASNFSSILLRYFTSEGNQRFFQDVVNILNQAKQRIKLYKQSAQSENNNSGTNIEYLMSLNDNELRMPDLILSDEYLNVLRVLKLLAADRQSSIFKTLLVKDSFDMVKEVAQLAKSLETVISKSNIDIAIEIFSALKEFVQNSSTNKSSAMSCQLIPSINRILLNNFYSRSEQGEDPDLTEKVYILKSQIMELLLGILEDDDQIYNQVIVNQISPKSFEKITHLLVEHKVPSDNAVVLASKSFRLIKKLVNNDTSKNNTYRQSLEICENNCRSRIGQIEVITKQSNIETIYFPIPQDFRRKVSNNGMDILGFFRGKYGQDSYVSMEERLKKDLEAKLSKKNIKWERASDKIDAFADWCQSKLLQREQRKFLDLNLTVKTKTIVKSWPLFWWLSFILAIAINLCLIATKERDKPSDETVSLVLYIFGAGNTICSGLTWILYLCHKYTYINQKSWISRLNSSENYMLHSFIWMRDTKYAPLYLNFTPFYYLASIWNVITRNRSLFFLVMFIFSILGNIYSPFFFAVHLFQILIRSASLRLILRALKKNAPTLLLMLVVLVFFILAFSAFGYAIFPEKYGDTTSGYGVKLTKDSNGLGRVPGGSLLQTLFSTIYYGLPANGGLFQYTNPYGTDAWNYTISFKSFVWVVYMMLFFVTIGPILLNMTFAVIVESFGEIRKDVIVAKRSLLSSCFICSLDRDTFQQNAKDFTVHIEKEHNVLHYFYFFAHLKDLEFQRKHNGTQFSSQLEEELFDAIQAKRYLKFFPVGRTLSLEDDNDSHDNNQKILDRVDCLHKYVEKANTKQDQNVKQSSEDLDLVKSLMLQIKSLRNELATLRRSSKSKSISVPGTPKMSTVVSDTDENDSNEDDN